MSKKALILLNMGGPNNLDEVEVFLNNMFNDKNIITVKSNLLRKMIAKFIVKSRTNEAKKNYEALGGKSPIVDNTIMLITKLQKEFENIMYVTYAMRYTPPYAQDILSALDKIGVDDIILLPLYPQYSTTTTKSSLEDFMEAVENSDKEYNISVIDRFYDNRLFCDMIVDDIVDELKDEDTSKYDLIFSAHSLPQKIVDRGDPYQKEVEDQVEILSAILTKREVSFNSIKIAYQSKLGPVKWLEPSLEDTIKENKNKNIIIYPLSFIIDNSETDFELSIEYKEIADGLGYENYRVCKCPNDSSAFVKVIKELVIGKNNG
jgi:ferrochelatase